MAFILSAAKDPRIYDMTRPLTLSRIAVLNVVAIAIWAAIDVWARQRPTLDEIVGSLIVLAVINGVALSRRKAAIPEEKHS